MPIPSLKCFLFPSTFFLPSFPHLAIPTGDDPGKGSMATGIGKRSLPAFLPHLGQFSHLPSAVKLFRASEPSQRPQELFRGSSVTAGIQKALEEPEQGRSGAPGLVSRQKPALTSGIGSSWIPAHAIPGASQAWMDAQARLGMATSRYHHHRDPCASLTASVIPLALQDTSLSMKHNKIHVSGQQPCKF